MIAGLKRTVAAFTMTVVAFLAYHVAAVPFIEPSYVDHKPADVPPIAVVPPTDRTRILRPYLSPDSWMLDNPKEFYDDRSRVLFKEYKTLDNGKVKLFPCAFVFFPNGEVADDVPQRVIILEAPQGAVLQFDGPVDLLQGTAVGQLQGGQMSGPITIHGTPSRPGANDEIFFDTRDVQLTPDKITTEAPVNFRFGPSTGHGRQLAIHLRPSNASAGGPRGPSIGGIDSLELLHDVQMQLVPGAGGIMPLDGQAGGRSPRPVSQPPVDIRCLGPFQFDLLQSVATFQEQVAVVRVVPNGPRDRMTCERLSVFFAPKSSAAIAPRPSAPVSTHGPSPIVVPESSQNLEPRRIEARGNPLVVQAESNGVFARAESLAYDIVAPREQDHLFSLIGNAQVSIARQGELAGDEIHMWLKELPPVERQRTANATLDKPASGAAPARGVLNVARMKAEGHVRINSPQLSGTASLLEAWFEQAATVSGPSNPAASANGGWVASAGGMAQAPASKLNPAGAAPRRFSVEGGRIRLQLLTGAHGTELEDITIDGHARFGELPASQPGEPPLLVNGDQIEVLRANASDTAVTVSGKPAEVGARGLVMNGDVIRLDKASNRVWIDAPGRMKIPANQAALAGISPTAIGSRDGAGPPPGQPAPLPRPPDPLYIAWKDRMVFDGLTARFEHSVVGQSSLRRFQTDVLEVSLRHRIDFSQPRMDERAEIGRIVCRDGMWMENRSFDPQDSKKLVAIDRMQTRDLMIDEVSGAILGQGPGLLTSVRSGSPDPTKPAGAPLAAGPVATPVANAAANQTGTRRAGFARGSAGRNGNAGERGQLDYLNVQFAGALSGNLNLHEITFHDHVRTVYGPVVSWEDQLNPSDVDDLGPDGVLMNCDQLTVRQTAAEPASQHRPIELEALGNTEILGDVFTAHAHSLKYSEAKDLLMLEGDGRNYAELFRQERPGDEWTRTEAGQIRYYRSTKRVSVDNARFFDLNQGPAPAGAKKPQKGSGGQQAAVGGAR